MRGRKQKGCTYQKFLDEELKYRKKLKINNDLERISREFKLYARYYDESDLDEKPINNEDDDDGNSNKKSQKSLIVCDIEGTFVDYVLVEDEESLCRRIGMRSLFTEIIIEEHQILLELIPDTHALRIGHHIKQFRIETETPENLASATSIKFMQHISSDMKNEPTLMRIRKFLISKTPISTSNSAQIRNNMVTYIKDQSKKKTISFYPKKVNAIPILRQHESQETISQQELSSVSHSSIRRDPRLMVSKKLDKFDFYGQKSQPNNQNLNKQLFPITRQRKAKNHQNDHENKGFNRREQSEERNSSRNQTEISELMDLLDQSERKRQHPNEINDELNSSFFKKLQKNQKNRILEKRFAGLLPNGMFQGDKKTSRNPLRDSKYANQGNPNRFGNIQAANQFGENQNQFTSQNGVILVDNQRQANRKRKRTLVNRDYVIIFNEENDIQKNHSRKKHQPNPTLPIDLPFNGNQDKPIVSMKEQHQECKQEQSSYCSNSFIPKREIFS